MKGRGTSLPRLLNTWLHPFKPIIVPLQTPREIGGGGTACVWSLTNDKKNPCFQFN